jgi:hypothetical protein
MTAISPEARALIDRLHAVDIARPRRRERYVDRNYLGRWSRVNGGRSLTKRCSVKVPRAPRCSRQAARGVQSSSPRWSESVFEECNAVAGDGHKLLAFAVGSV